MLYPPLNRQYRVIEDFADQVMSACERGERAHADHHARGPLHRGRRPGAVRRRRSCSCSTASRNRGTRGASRCRRSAAAGIVPLAPDQRGYSAGVRPDPAAGLAAYAVDRLVADVLDLATAEGHGAKPFHLVGHDWPGHVAWATAHRHPERVASLTILSRSAPGGLPPRLSGKRGQSAASLAPPQDLP